jgi:lipoprotein-anchoring transpeptidase ErfK/SrfK
MKRLNSLIVISILTSILHSEKFILIDLNSQMGYAYKDGELIMSGRVSTGKEGYRTPTGYYTILEKKRFHKSNLWPKPDGGAKMDYMLRLTNTGIAMHLGAVPKRPASHGCIRLKNGFAQELWKWATVGTQVEVSGFIEKLDSKERDYQDNDNYFDDTYFISD